MKKRIKLISLLSFVLTCSLVSMDDTSEWKEVTSTNRRSNKIRNSGDGSYYTNRNNRNDLQHNEHINNIAEKFCIACKKDNIQTVDNLLASHAELVNFPFKGKLPLSLAASHGHLGLALHLITKGAQINVYDNNLTILHWALLPKKNAKKSITEDDIYELIKLLIQYGADRTIKNKRNESAYDIARKLITFSNHKKSSIN